MPPRFSAQRILAILLGASGLVAATSQTEPAPAEAAGARAAPAAVGIRANRDEKIEAAIRAKLKKALIGQDGFNLRVQGGVAYWDGSTSVLQHKDAATRLAKSCGARTVVNNITVSGAPK